MKILLLFFPFFLIFNQRIFVRTIEGASKISEPHLQEFFVDSTTIARKKLHKIELSLYNENDSNYVVIKFYSKSNSAAWKLRQTFSFPRSVTIPLETQISDFNNDGFNDMTYISDAAGRGANEVRRLFIYDKKNDRLTLIQNSESYPNMQYNRELNCIDAFLVYGGCSTVFLHIVGDQLKEFASVDVDRDDGLTVYTIDNHGKRKIIHRDKNKPVEFIRYRNFKPLKE
jgi:hypothetical protein